MYTKTGFLALTLKDGVRTFKYRQSSLPVKNRQILTGVMNRNSVDVEMVQKKPLFFALEDQSLPRSFDLILARLRMCVSPSSDA